jgi:hypothetical protein
LSRCTRLSRIPLRTLWYVSHEQFLLAIQLNNAFNKLGSYVLLALLSQKCIFSPAALQVVVGEIVSASHSVRTTQFVQTLVAVCGPQDAMRKLPTEVAKGILRIPYVFLVQCTAER